MSLLKKLAGDTVVYGLSSILSRVLNFVILVPYLTNAFSRKEYGVVTEMYAYIALLMVIFTYRMETTFFRFASREKEQGKSFSTASSSLLLTTLIFGGLLILSAQSIANLLHYPDHKDYVIWIILIVIFDTMSAIPLAKLRLENRPIRFASIKVISIIVNIIAIFFFLEVCPQLVSKGWEGLKVIYKSDDRIAYIFIANFLASGVVLLILLPEYLKTRLRFDWVLWKKMLRYAGPLIIVGLTGVINQLISQPLLKLLLPYDLERNTEMVGVYGACFKIAILMSLFIQAFNYAAEPFFFNQAKRSDSREIYAQVGQAFALVGSLVFLGIMLYIDVVQYLIGKDFREGLTVVPILLLAFFFLGLYYNFSIWYKLNDRTIFGAYISVIGAVITLTLNFWLIPQIGYSGAAWASFACYAFMAIASYGTGQYYYPIQYPVKRMISYIFLAIGAYFVSISLRSYLSENLLYILSFNTGILLLFLGAIYQLEKTNIQRVFFQSRKP
ncbi:MAG: oligosaccharide flippase family protein [Bacteroidota bacterium]